jgi:DNA-binding MarR family transcriptional regulator
MSVQSVAPGPRYQALIQLLRTAESLWNASRVFFERWDLSPSQFNILNLLRGRPDGLSQIELSRELIMHRSNVTGLIDRLESRDLVERKEMANDRRAYRVVLSAKGHGLMERILPQYYKAAEEVWGRLPARKVNQLVDDLSAISQNATRIAESLKKDS